MTKMADIADRGVQPDGLHVKDVGIKLPGDNLGLVANARDVLNLGAVANIGEGAHTANNTIVAVADNAGANHLIFNEGGLGYRKLNFTTGQDGEIQAQWGPRIGRAEVIASLPDGIGGGGNTVVLTDAILNEVVARGVTESNFYRGQSPLAQGMMQDSQHAQNVVSRTANLTHEVAQFRDVLEQDSGMTAAEIMSLGKGMTSSSHCPTQKFQGVQGAVHALTDKRDAQQKI